MSASFDFMGKVVVVTGGTFGIGAAIVCDFLEAGATVVTCARRPLKSTKASSVVAVQQLEQDEEVCSNRQEKDDGPVSPLMGWKHHPRLRFVVADVSTDAGRERLFFAAASAGRASVLVNNVGTNIRRLAHEYSASEYQALHSANLESAFFLCQMFHPQLRQSRGAVVNVSSVSGQTSDGTGVVYHMTKAALDHMTRYLAVEWGAHPVRVNSVAPWFIRTPLTEPILHGDLLNLVQRRTPMKRTGECREVSQAVLFLASDAASYVSGQILTVDGAFTCNGFNLNNDRSLQKKSAALDANRSRL